jgi:hypothetical protein
MSEIGESGAPAKDLGPLEALARLVRFCYAPRRAAGEIRDSPNWVFPLLLSLVLSFLLAAVLFSRPEWKEALQKGLASAPQTLGELEKVQLLKALQAAAWVGFLAAMVIGNLFLALLLWGLSGILGGRPRFMTVFSLQLHAQSVTLIPQAVGLGYLLLRKGSSLGPGEPLPFSIAYFLPAQGTPPFLQGLASSVDFFTLWYWGLVLLGLPIVARIPFRKVLLPMLFLLFFGILIRAAALTLALTGP